VEEEDCVCILCTAVGSSSLVDWRFGCGGWLSGFEGCQEKEEGKRRATKLKLEFCVGLGCQSSLKIMSITIQTERFSRIQTINNIYNKRERNMSTPDSDTAG